MATMTLRLDMKLQREIEIERKHLHLSRSEVVRQAIQDFLKKQEKKRFMAEMVRAANVTDSKRNIAYAEEGLEWGDRALSVGEGMEWTEKPQPKKRPHKAKR